MLSTSATMSQPDLLDLPVPEWLMDDAHVYLWILDGENCKNAHALFDHWSIVFKETHAWNKTYPSGIPRLGLGHYFRNNVEYILFGVRGNLPTQRAARSLGKCFTAPVVGEHSEKPDEFYQRVRAASYPPFGEVFQRKPRDGFINLYEERAVAKKAAAYLWPGLGQPPVLVEIVNLFWGAAVFGLAAAHLWRLWCPA
jgi:N6-adenosine-specific RNA methylase IME4